MRILFKMKNYIHKNIFGLNLLRGIAIFLMFITHTFRIYLKEVSEDFLTLFENSFLDRLLYFFSIIEPFTPALFLFLVGFSIVLSYRKENNHVLWFKKTLKRIIILYILGFFIFLFSYGFQYPDVIFANNILSCISFCTLITALLVMFRMKALSLILGIIISLTFTYFIEDGYTVPGLNAGPGGSMPLLSICMTGALMNLLYENEKSKGLKSMTVVVAFVSLIAFLIDGDWTTTHSSFYNDYSITPSFLGWFKHAFLNEGNAVLTEHRFWNHNVITYFRFLFPLIGGLTLFLSLGNWFESIQNKFFRMIFHSIAILGRHSLGVYVSHLALIGIVDVFGLRPVTALQNWIFVFILVFVFSFFFYLKENYFSKLNSTFFKAI